VPNVIYQLAEFRYNRSREMRYQVDLVRGLMALDSSLIFGCPSLEGAAARMPSRGAPPSKNISEDRLRTPNRLFGSVLEVNNKRYSDNQRRPCLRKRGCHKSLLLPSDPGVGHLRFCTFEKSRSRSGIPHHTQRCWYWKATRYQASNRSGASQGCAGPRVGPADG